MLQKTLDGICAVLSALAVLCLALMVVMVFGNVVLRYGFNSSILVSEELSRWLFVWMTFLGAVVAVRKRLHLGTEMLVARLPALGRKICLVLTHLIMIYLCWLMLDGAWQQTLINLGSTSAVMQVSMAWFFSAGVLFAVLCIVILLESLWRLLTGRMTEAELAGLSASEEASDGIVPNTGSPR